ncbi:MAG: hypothetical protein HY474_02080 [Candidatus Sungbacteria bacterium]|uniref:Uncharacterized protein n=1 Tax=Candidatus Sungiibacteriota bacterium TaxID=2750080 RepID=A0A932YY74_9BACT|nr:hypothetical protein [Candidatus Sungbacteria bacterium]
MVLTLDERCKLEKELDFSHGVISVRTPREWPEYLWPGTWLRGLIGFFMDAYGY